MIIKNRQKILKIYSSSRPLSDLQKYVGTYHNNLYGIITIYLEKNNLVITSKTFKGQLQHTNNYNFELLHQTPDNSAIPTYFEYDGTNKIISFILKTPELITFNKLSE